MSEHRDPGPGDDQARRRIRYELDQTLFVEAGAGTGKTTALVGRIVELIATGTAPLRQLAAITFTEAAAGELRDRIRERLERLADGQDDDEAAVTSPDRDRVEHRERLVRIAEALTELDAAAISTLHGFAQRILAEHPFEAGLPPTFEVYDQIRSRVAFDERWDAFLDELLDTEAARPAQPARPPMWRARRSSGSVQRSARLVATPTAAIPAKHVGKTQRGGWISPSRQRSKKRAIKRAQGTAAGNR